MHVFWLCIFKKYKNTGYFLIVPDDDCNLDPVYTVPDPNGYDIKLNSFTTSVRALTLTIVLQNLTTSGHIKKW